MTLKLFSVDDHIIEPATVWTDRLPSAYREAGPHVVSEDGQEFWVYEDQRSGTMGLNAVVGKPRELWNTDATRFSDMRPGCYDPAARAKDMRSEGMVGSVLIPTLPGFGGRLFAGFKDKHLADLCVKAYNDFVLDEWCPADPTLYVPTIIVQLWDPELAAEEVRRCAGRGARSVAFPENTIYIDLPSLHQLYWEPVWDAFEETDMVISMHLGGSGRMPMATPDSHFASLILGAPLSLASEVLADLLTSDIIKRHPDLKFVLTEGGSGWVPYLLERADHQAELHAGWWHSDERPSDVFRRNFFVCLVNERHAIEQRHSIGVHNLLWEYDYPHAECPFPNGQQQALEQFKGVPDDETQLMAWQNAARIFRWDVA